MSALEVDHRLVIIERAYALLMMEMLDSKARVTKLQELIEKAEVEKAEKKSKIVKKE